MKNKAKLFGIIALRAVIVFSMTLCGTMLSIVSIGASEPQEAYTGDATHLRGRNDQKFTFYITGASGGSVWGSDVYTDDSNIARAAVHAGIVAVGESKTVTITILSGRSSYAGTTRNGVTTDSYGSWHGSYSFGESAVAQEAYTGDATHLRGRNDQTFTFYITGASGGSVWGSDVYTDDSNIARAAVHAGIVAVGESKTVTIRILPGRSSYESTTRNGVTTASYGSWHGSYSFVR